MRASRQPEASTSSDAFPRLLVTALQATGWHLVGGKEDSYSRLAPPGEDSERYFNIIVPLNPEAPDYEIQMEAAMSAVSRTQNSDWAQIQSILTKAPADQFRFSKETAAPSGFIRWSDGEKMFGQAKSILAAGAKSHVEKAPYFANRLGQYAKRFLDIALMGQTQPGSYVVTAFVPSDELISLYSAKSEGLMIDGLSANTREVSISILNSIEAAFEALQYFHHRSSYSAFEQSVERGVSFEMLHSLAGLAEHSDGATVSVEFSSPDRLMVRQSAVFEFRPTDAPILRFAGDRLLDDFPERTITVIGRVHLLRKDVGLPSMIGIEWTGPVGRKKIRVRLADEGDYVTAVQAHLDGKLIQLTGSLVRAGRHQLLLDAARLDAVIEIETDPSDELSEEFLF